MRAPLQAAAADQSAAFFKTAAVVENAVAERTPSRRPEVHVPVRHLLAGVLLRSGPAAGFGAKAARMGVEDREFAQLAALRQAGRKLEVGQAAPLRPGLQQAPGPAESLGQNQALDDVFGGGLLAIDVLAGLGRHDRGQGMPVGTGGNQHGVDVRPS